MAQAVIRLTENPPCVRACRRADVQAFMSAKKWCGVLGAKMDGEASLSRFFCPCHWL